MSDARPLGSQSLEVSAIELARRIRAREVSPIEVIDTHVARIEEVNPSLNAVVRPLFDAARAEARTMAARLSASSRLDGELPPFFGVPFTCKEHLQVVGLPNTGGLLRRRDRVSDRDAEVVARMRRAGFVLLGTTNVPEGLTWYESYNKVYGRTNNAYDLGRTAGGSSGGEGAIIGAGGSPVGIGGDMGGSIRLPAFFNGIPGHKPSGGSIPETGAWPGTRGMIRRYKVLGPMARTVADLRAVMPILAGPDGRDGSVDDRPWRTCELAPEQVKVHWFDDNGIVSPSDDVRRAVADAVAALRDRGCAVEAYRPPGIERGLELWAGAVAQAGGPKFSEVMGDGETIALLSQWLRWPMRRADHILPVLGLMTIERILDRMPGAGARMADLRHALRDAIESKLGPTGVLVCPVFHRTAPRHGLSAVRHFLGFSYSGTFNPLEVPSTAVPTGFGTDGLPVGVQVVAARNADALTLRVAEWIEQSLGGWCPPWRARPAPSHARSQPRSVVPASP